MRIIRSELGLKQHGVFAMICKDLYGRDFKGRAGCRGDYEKVA